MIFNLLASFILIFITTLIASTILGEKIKSHNLPSIIISSIYVYVIYIAFNNEIRLLINYLILNLVFYNIFKNDISKTMAISFLSYFIIILSEILFLILVLGIIKIPADIIIEYSIGNFFSNLIIAGIGYIICIKFKQKFQKIYKNIINGMDKILIGISFLLILIIGFHFFNTFKDGWNNQILLYYSFLIIIILNIMFTLIFIEKAKTKNYKDYYIYLMNHASKMEGLMEKYRKTNHENRNNLLMIKSLPLNKKNEYIEELLSITKVENKIIKFKKLEDEVVRNFLLEKNHQALEKGININVEILPKRLTKLNLKKVKILTRILGILIDNALDELETKEEKEILITINQDSKNTFVEVINFVDQKIDLEKIYKKGYTTKEKGRGLGLFVAKEIISKQKDFHLRSKYYEPYFIQEIKIFNY